MIEVTAVRKIEESETFRLVETVAYFQGSRIMLQVPLDCDSNQAKRLGQGFEDWWGCILHGQ